MTARRKLPTPNVPLTDNPAAICKPDIANQKILNTPVGQMDWIGAFSLNDRKLRVEIHLTPVVHCYDAYRNSLGAYPPCLAVGRTKSPTVVYAAPVRVLPRMRYNHTYLLARSLADLPGVSGQTKLHGLTRPPLTSVELAFTLRDGASFVAPFRDIKRKFPKLTNIIESWSPPCPPSVSFYIARDNCTTVIVPTAEILRECYMPDRMQLEAFLTATEERSFLGNFIGFDGFRYVKASGDPIRFWPMRAKRNVRRAEYEMSQLMPRAVAYYQRYGKILPILVRPPFEGPVQITGRAVIESSRERNVIFFPLGTHFGPHFPRKDRRASSHLTMPFAPFLRWDGIELAEICAWTPTYERDLQSEAHDVHLFPRMAAAVIQGIECGSYSHPVEQLFHRNDFGGFRQWLLRKNRV